MGIDIGPNTFAPQESHKNADRRIASAVASLQEKSALVSPIIAQSFADDDLLDAVSAEIENPTERIAGFLEHSSRFADLIASERTRRFNKDTSGLLGEEVLIPETMHRDGRTRRAEGGYRINVDYLKTVGIEASEVLFFRTTLPAEEPKPEYYWTSDYMEVTRGLSREISPQDRAKAIILVASLNTINKNGGLIQDINDDNGLAVRQIGTGPFDQHNALAQIKTGLGSIPSQDNSRIEP